MSRKSVSIVISLLMLVALLPATFAEDDSRDAVTLTVSQPIAVPGTVLEPGNYTLQFTGDSYRTVAIHQANGASIGLFSVISAYRAEPTSALEVDVLRDGNGARISSWFLPGRTTGWEFIYRGKASRQFGQSDKVLAAGK